MGEKRFDGDISRLRSDERIALLEIEHVMAYALEGIEARSILDVGTGSGIFAEAFAGKGLAVSGVDANPSMEVHFHHYVPHGDFRQSSAEALPFEDASFDVVFMGHVLHETDDALKALQEARRLARMRVLILEWPYRDEPKGPPLGHRLKTETVIQWAGEAGFLKIETLPLSHMNLFRLDL